MKLDDTKKTEYYRNVVIAKAYKTNIKTIHDEIDGLVNIPSSQLTEKQREGRQLVIKSKTETLKRRNKRNKSKSKVGSKRAQISYPLPLS